MYRREIMGIKDTWHSIPFPNDLYKVFDTYNDIRILGITAKGDTIEAPYFIKTNAQEITTVQRNFNLINQTHNAKGYYYTFEAPTADALNEIVLHFKNTDFDWVVDLEGSNNQKEWFKILDDYRIIGIINPKIEYKYTTLHFPSAQYRYWRVCVKTPFKPNFESAELNFNSVVKGKYIIHIKQNINIEEHKQKRQTIVLIDLTEYLPVSYLKIEIKDTIDYVRNMSFYYLSDTTLTKPFWTFIKSATLSSLENKDYYFNTVLTKNLKIVTENNDNAPLKMGDIVLQGNPHEFVARFIEPAHYYLYYGKKNGTKPQYDIENFVQKIPTVLTPLTLSQEAILGNAQMPAEPFFKNKLWLWGIMLLIMLVLIGQSLKMMQKKG